MRAQEFLQLFLRHLRVERNLSPNTIATYQYHLKGYLGFLKQRGVGPSAAAQADVLAFLESKKDQGIKGSSLFGVANAIRRFHRFLVCQGHLSADPTAGLTLPKFSQRLPDPLGVNEMERLLNLSPGGKFHRIRNLAFIETMYSTGARVSELISLKMDGVNLAEGWIRVLAKGGGERLLPLGPRATNALNRYLEARRNRFPLAPNTLFLNSRGRGLTRGGFWRELKKMAREAGIQGRVFPHRIRHSTGTHLLAGGADIRVVQETLGHRLLTITQRYTHVATELIRQTLQKAHPRF